MTSGEIQVLDRQLAVVVACKEQSLLKRPLMWKIDKESDPDERLLGMMATEMDELRVELNGVEGLPRERWNGHGVRIASEAADVLVFAAAARLLHPHQVMGNLDYWRMIQVAILAGEMAGVDVPSTAVGVITNKVARFNYPEWAFQNWPSGETLEQAKQRYAETVLGLKQMRKTHPDGLLTQAILEAFGFQSDTHGQDPVLAYAFLRQVANGGLGGVR